ncbi:MAG: NAD(P)H-dependent glycerol-3-phosphate dehydrogenase [Betaproteobacteria bacterium]|nr:NAD(P)H-dependent glycerol-3-phosphate dehydrogenase [Betaproteobacteria bacterium]
MKLAVLGAGAWGTALAIVLARKHSVALWARDEAHARVLADTRRNDRYLPGFELTAAIDVSAELARTLAGAEAAVCAVPMSGLRELMGRLPHDETPLVLVCKGFEPASGLLAHEVVQSVQSGRMLCALSGPSFAAEVAAGQPTAVVLASADVRLAASLARALHNARLRIYSNDDLVGVEVAGAAKNVMAIAAGICDGLRLGHNARAAMITRGLAEISRLGTRLGGRVETFMGLAGAGDLILTCTGDLSRNRTVGLRLAAGEPLPEILRSLGHVAEGVSTAYELARLASLKSVEMPITRAVCGVLDGALAPAAAVSALLERDLRAEF